MSAQNVTLSNHTQFVTGVAFSSDHSFLASCSGDGFLSIWSPTSNWSLKNHLSNEPCNALIQLPNGQLAASSSKDIKIWSPLTNQTASLRTLTGHTKNVFGLALSPDESLLASGSLDNTTKIWNYTSQTTAFMTLTGHTNLVRALCFVSDQILASGSFDNTIKIWNISSGKSKNYFMNAIFFFAEIIVLKSIRKTLVCALFTRKENKS